MTASTPGPLAGRLQPYVPRVDELSLEMIEYTTNMAIAAAVRAGEQPEPGLRPVLDLIADARELRRQNDSLRLGVAMLTSKIGLWAETDRHVGATRELTAIMVSARSQGFLP